MVITKIKKKKIEINKYPPSSPMGNEGSELKTVAKNKFKHSRYYASPGYLQVLKRSEKKNAEKTC